MVCYVVVYMSVIVCPAIIIISFFSSTSVFFFTNTTTVLYVAKENGEIEKPKNEADGKILHRTQSIFIRNLAPNITKQEVEAVSIV